MPTTQQPIDIGIPDGEVRSVKAIRDGVLTGERLELTSPVIELFLADGAMDRLVAIPLRPDSVIREEDLDSADIVRPVRPAHIADHPHDVLEIRLSRSIQCWYAHDRGAPIERSPRSLSKARAVLNGGRGHGLNSNRATQATHSDRRCRGNHSHGSRGRHRARCARAPQFADREPRSDRI